MALILLEGFDNAATIADIKAKGWQCVDVDAALTTGRWSGKAVQIYDNDNRIHRVIALPNPVIIGCAVKITDPTPYYGGFANVGICNASSTTRLGIHFTDALTCDLRRGSLSSSTQIGIGTYQVPLDAWFYFECKLYHADSGGYAEVRINGVEVENWTGLDTYYSTANGIILSAGSVGANQGILYDDLYVADTTGGAPYNTFLGEVRVDTLYPDANGTTNQFTASAGSNYQNVDESPGPDGDTTYNYSPTVGNKDLYNMTALPLTYDNILAVKPEIVCRKTDVGTRTVKAIVRSGTTESDGTQAHGCDETYNSFDGDILTQDPDTAAAWGNAGVNAAQVGVKIAS